MRLITQNMLICNKKGVENGFPLKITISELETVETEFQAEFITKMLAKIDWSAFHQAVQDINLFLATSKQEPEIQLPVDKPADSDMTEEFLKCVHHALLNVHVKNGILTCPESGREFPITDGIPNMLLREDEV